MQTNINKEIRTYQEEVFMGLSLRQLLCSVGAIGAAVGSYFALRGVLGQETVSWVCIVCAAPIAAAGFFEYDGMTFEKFLGAVWRSAFVCAGPRVWKSENRYARTGKSTRKVQRKLDKRRESRKSNKVWESRKKRRNRSRFFTRLPTRISLTRKESSKSQTERSAAKNETE